MTPQRKVLLFMAMSLDGFISGPDDDLSFLDAMQVEGEDYNYQTVTSSVGTLILGRKTYDKVLSFGIPWPHSGKEVFVMSRTRSGIDENVSYYNGDIAHLVDRLKAEEGGDIYLDAGAEIVGDALQRDLIDQIVISLVPILLGAGKRLFESERPSQMLKLERTLTYPSGLVQLWYNRNRQTPNNN